MDAFRIPPSEDHMRSLLIATVIGCLHAPVMETPVAQAIDWAPLIEDLILFKRTAVRDSVPIDACTIQAATNDARILERLSERARRDVVLSMDCTNEPLRSNASSRSLLSVRQTSDSVIAEVYVKNGEYVHLATYKAFPTREPRRFSFATVTLHDFAVAGRAPPPPPPPPRRN